MIGSFRISTQRLLRVVAASLLCLTAAFGQKIQTEFDSSVNFSGFKTFTIAPGRMHSADPSLNNELTQKKLAADIQQSMEAKGLTMVNPGKADLRVVYTLGTPRGVQTEAYPAGWRGWGTRVVKVPYTKGTLVIDLRNTATHSLAWRSIARDDETDASKIESKLDRMVKKSFDKYPPKVGK